MKAAKRLLALNAAQLGSVSGGYYADLGNTEMFINEDGILESDRQGNFVYQRWGSNRSTEFSINDQSWGSWFQSWLPW